MAQEKETVNGADITPNEVPGTDNSKSGTDNLRTETGKLNYSAIVSGEVEVNEDELTGREKSNVTGCNNLIPFTADTSEQAKINGAKGGRASGIAKRKQRDMREVAKAILYHAMNEEQIQEVLGTSESLLDGDKSVMAVLTARMVQEAGKGSYKHYETLRDTAGFKPKDEVDISADIMTDADRSLLEKVGKRLNVKNG